MSDLFKTFKVRRGYCHVLEEGLLLNADEIPGNGPFETKDKAYWGIVGRQVLFIALLAYWVYDNFMQGYWKSPLFYSVMLLYIVARTIYVAQFSYVNFIPRESIHYIKIHHAIPFVRVNTLVVHFSKDGKQLKRMIPMPGYLNNPKESLEDAVEILKEENLYTPGADDSQLIDSI